MVKAQPADQISKNGLKRAVPVNIERHGRAALPQKTGRLKQHLEPLFRYKPSGGEDADRAAGR